MVLGRAESTIVFLFLDLQKETFDETSRPPPTWVNTACKPRDCIAFSGITEGRPQRFPLLPDFGSN